MSFLCKKEGKENEENIKINCEIDRIYFDIKDKDLILFDEKKKYSKIVIKRNGFNDCVLWNPWIDKSKKMSDFDDNEYKNMICIEPGNVYKPITLEPNQSWFGEQILIPSLSSQKL